MLLGRGGFGRASDGSKRIGCLVKALIGPRGRTRRAAVIAALIRRTLRSSRFVRVADVTRVVEYSLAAHVLPGRVLPGCVVPGAAGSGQPRLGRTQRVALRRAADQARPGLVRAPP